MKPLVRFSIDKSTQITANGLWQYMDNGQYILERVLIPLKLSFFDGQLNYFNCIQLILSLIQDYFSTAGI